MEKLGKKMKHNHLLTNLLKFGIFSLVMLAPIFSVASRCLYVICNKNAKDSYSDYYMEKRQEINEDTMFIESENYLVKYNGTPYVVPNDYQVVEYIESTGTQHINTGITPGLTTDELKITMKYATTSASFQNSDNMFFGSGTPSNNDVCYFIDATRNKNAYIRYYNDTASTTENGLFNTYPNGVMVLDSNGLSINGSTPIALTTSGNTSNDLPIYIFARNGTTMINSSYKLYRFQMEKNGTFVRDYIPCYRKNNNVIGLYDMINDEFYTNAGTGTFTKGNNASNFIERPYGIENSSWMNYKSISINWVDYGFNDLNYVSFMLSNNGYVYIKDNLGTIYSKPNLWGNTLLQFSFIYLDSNLTNWNKGDVSYYLYVYAKGTLDNVFEYSLSQLEESSYYNWTTNLGIYTPIHNMTSGLGAHDIVALLIAYWSIYIAIYIVFDIVIVCFTKISHLINGE